MEESLDALRPTESPAETVPSSEPETIAAATTESATGEDGIVKAGSGWTEIFIYPGYKFKAIDGLITNFHLPESTLLMLVSALAGKEHIMAAYEEAVKEKYRFFSFGDAMMIE